MTRTPASRAAASSSGAAGPPPSRIPLNRRRTASVSGRWRVQQPLQLGGHQGREADLVRQLLRGRGERLGGEAFGEVHGPRAGPREEGTHQHLHPGDVLQREREQPLPLALERKRRRHGRCRQRLHSEDRRLGRSGGAGGAHHHGGVLEARRVHGGNHNMAVGIGGKFDGGTLAVEGVRQNLEGGIDGLGFDIRKLGSHGAALG